MGGGLTIPPGTESLIKHEDTITGKEDSSLDQDSQLLSSPLPSTSNVGMGTDDGAEDQQSESGSNFGDYGRLRDLKAKEMMRQKVYREVMESSEMSWIRSKYSKEAKTKILRYTPGAWIETAGAMKRRDYDVPKTTTLLLVGPKGSGKSSLVNRISKVLEEDKFASERAQVSYNSSVGDGTVFLQEYMIPRGSTSFCIYDTRSLSGDSAENIEVLKHWMENGVRHGQLATRDSDCQSLRTVMMCKAHDNNYLSSEIRKVNFVIFSVNGISVLKALESENDEDTQYTQMIVSMFNSPYLAFKDDKPAVVVTHGDLLSNDERARIRVHLGELLGIPPTTQVFDIPERSDPVTECTIIEMLRYSLEHAEKNLPHKKKVQKKYLLPWMLLLMLLGTAINIWCMCHHHAHMQQGPLPLPFNQHCQPSQTHIQQCPLLQANVEHDHGSLPEEFIQTEPLPQEHIQKDALPEEHIQKDALPEEQIQKESLSQEHNHQDPLPQEHVQHCTSLGGHVQHDHSPSSEILTQHDTSSPSISLTHSFIGDPSTPPPPSVPSADMDNSLVQESIQDGSLASSPQAHLPPDHIPSYPLHYGPVPRMQAELEKIMTKVGNFKTKLDWSKIRGMYLDEDSQMHIDWKKIRHLYLDEDSKIRIDWKKIRHLYLDEDSKIRIDWKKIRHMYLDE